MLKMPFYNSLRILTGMLARKKPLPKRRHYRKRRVDIGGSFEPEPDVTKFTGRDSHVGEVRLLPAPSMHQWDPSAGQTFFRFVLIPIILIIIMNIILCTTTDSLLF